MSNKNEEVETEFNKNKKTDLSLIDPRKIAQNPNNHRHIDVADVDMQELIASIKANGIITPLMLKPNPNFGVDGETREFVSYAGNRRITAVLHLIGEGIDIKYVPAQVKKNVSLETEFLTQLVENSGKPFTFLEKAEVISELINICNWTPADIEKHTGETQAAISNYLTVSGMTKKQKKMLSDKTITATLALQILRESDNPEEFETKMNELFEAGEQLRASGTAKKSKRALITASGAKNVLVKKKPIDILENACVKLEEKQINNQYSALLITLTQLLRKQTKTTEKDIVKLFSGE